MNGIYDRPRINVTLSGALKVPLTVISATSGYGKTTAVYTFLQHRTIAHTWVTLTSRDEYALLEKLSRALRPFSEALADQLLTMNLSEVETQSAPLISLIRDTLHHPFLMVMDDCQNITESHFYRLAEILAYEQLPFFHLVLISRERPPLPLETLCSKRLCLCIGTSDLAFNAEETACLFQSAHITPERATDLTKKTDGWIAALSLLKWNASLNGETRINRLLEENLLQPLPGKAREQLCRLSAIDNFNGDLAAAALQDPDIRTLLTGMVRSNSFLTVDEEGKYRFHSLLLSYLRANIPDDEEQKQVYYRAGLWCIEHHYNILSLPSLFERAGRIEELFQKIEQTQAHWISFLECDLIYRIARWYAPAKYDQYPLVFIQVCFSLLLDKNPTYRIFAMKIHDRLYVSLNRQPASEHRDRLLAELLIIRRLTCFDDAHEWNPLLARAAALLNGHTSLLINRNSPFTFGLPMLSDSEYFSAGTLDEAVQRCQTNLFEQIADGFGYGSEKQIQAEAALLRMQLESARRYAKQALLLAAEKQQNYVAISACYVQLQCDILEGKPGSEQQWRDEIGNLCANVLRREYTRFNQSSSSQLTDLIQGMTAVALRKPDLVPEKYRTSNDMKSFMLDGMGISALLAGRYALLVHQEAEAEALLERLAGSSGLAISQNARLEALAGLCIVRTRLDGLTEQALEPLTAALAEAETDGVLLPFVSYGEELIKPLQALSKKQPYALSVLDQCRKQLQLAPRCPQASLTRKEIDILILIEKGQTTREIAAGMFVSEVTVKKHLSSIYGKLGARNRTEAVRLGRLRGLLDS